MGVTQKEAYNASFIRALVLESGHPPEVRQITISHSVVLNENKDLYRNHLFFARMQQ
ncbi:MAG TPA: hypothetical protein VMQ10_02145 [Spirochaetia bacterium]|nr:hypothetical protein [Spirochaetia bacterium]